LNENKGLVQGAPMHDVSSEISSVSQITLTQMNKFIKFIERERQRTLKEASTKFGIPLSLSSTTSLASPPRNTPSKQEFFPSNWVFTLKEIGAEDVLPFHFA
jgi:hypothetical protein